ncbi:hypothetical protein OE09_0888 [Flavobacteriaceae bacterium MAR_2010_72]|nr:hypothetical protein OE09_0888 [Flavobacteriaceae bacterium MAR_2010_72]
MIKFFRHIRQRLLSENKFRKYLLYALGEIILVMIGILLAFQVSSWKEQRDNKKLELQMMADLNSEFRNNLTKIKASINQYEGTEQAIRLLMSKMKASPEVLKHINSDSLIAIAIDVFDYRPTQNTLTEILSTGNLKLISKDSLKYKLLDWSAELNEINEAWLTLDDFNQRMVIPYLTENASMRNIDKYSLMAWEEKSKFEIDYNKLFHDLKFENHLDNLGWSVVNYKMVLDRLELVIMDIIRLTDD